MRPSSSTSHDAPGEGELLSMRSVGICSSDLLYLRVGTEHVLGLELAGVRADGTAVAVEGLYGCGTCEHCLDGRINLCPQSPHRALRMMADGGMAEQFTARFWDASGPLMARSWITWVRSSVQLSYLVTLQRVVDPGGFHVPG